MRRTTVTNAWLVTVLAGAALALLGAACGGTATGGSATPSPTASPTSSPGASATASPAASGSPVANVVQAAPVQHVAVGDLSMGYRVIGPLAPTAGSAPAGTPLPLLLIMGSSGTMDMWSPEFVAALAQDRQVIVFDNRGIGETDDPSGRPYQFPRLADDTAGLINALGYDSLDVLGWSMGGEVAVDLAVRHPAAVSRLVSYAGDPGGRLTLPPTKAAMLHLYRYLTDETRSPARLWRAVMLTLLIVAMMTFFAVYALLQ